MRSACTIINLILSTQLELYILMYLILNWTDIIRDRVGDDIKYIYVYIYIYICLYFTFSRILYKYISCILCIIYNSSILYVIHHIYYIKFDAPLYVWIKMEFEQWDIEWWWWKINPLMPTGAFNIWTHKCWTHRSALMG